MDRTKQPIGVLDSGIGGLTVVKNLRQLLPGEDVLYFGDSANCPYGNRTKQDILRLMNRILDFMERNEVKCVAVACNTLSTLFDEYAPARKTKIFSIVQAAADAAVAMDLDEIGLVCTEFTANSGWYEKLIHDKKPGMKVFTASNSNLASTLDQGRFDLVPDNVHRNMQRLLAMGHPSHVILGCTHYPIVREQFEKEAPDICFLDPAYAQAKAIADWLAREDLLQEEGSCGRLEVVTSGEPAFYQDMLTLLGIGKADILRQEYL